MTLGMTEPVWIVFRNYGDEGIADTAVLIATTEDLQQLLTLMDKATVLKGELEYFSSIQFRDHFELTWYENGMDLVDDNDTQILDPEDLNPDDGETTNAVYVAELREANTDYPYLHVSADYVDWSAGHRKMNGRVETPSLSREFINQLLTGVPQLAQQLMRACE